MALAPDQGTTASPVSCGLDVASHLYIIDFDYIVDVDGEVFPH